MWPQIAMIVLFVMAITIALVKDGQPRENYSFWTTFISLIIECGILYAGGFFDVLNK